MSACTYADSRGITCKFPGVLSHSLHGDHKWKCIWHWQLLNSSAGPSDGRVHGDEIVRQSYEWDERAESYRAMRALVVKAKPGVAAHAGGSGVGDVPAKVADLVPDVWLREPGEDEECLSESEGLTTR